MPAVQFAALQIVETDTDDAGDELQFRLGPTVLACPRVSCNRFGCQIGELPLLIHLET